MKIRRPIGMDIGHTNVLKTENPSLTMISFASDAHMTMSCPVRLYIRCRLKGYVRKDDDVGQAPSPREIWMKHNMRLLH